MVRLVYLNAAEILQPGKHPFYFPATLVAALRPPVMRLRPLSPAQSMRRYRFNATVSGQSGIKRVAVGRCHRLCLQLGTPVSHRDKTLGDSRFNKGDLMRRSRRNVYEYGDRKTIAVCNCHDLRNLAPLGRSPSNLVPPFLATPSQTYCR